MKPHQGHKRAARRGISTVFTLIGDLLVDRQRELASGVREHASGSTQPALLDDIALERQGRMLELVELANRISVLGFERFGQRLQLQSAVEQNGPSAARKLNRRGAR